MNNEAMKEVLNELFSHLERLETQSEAILQFLKEKKRVTEKQLAPYLEQAGNASNVKWRAARVRIEHLLSPEHPEEEIKLGKAPELKEEPARAVSSEANSSGTDSKEKRGESGDKDKPALADDIQERPTEAKAEKPDSSKEKSASEQGRKEHAPQAKPEQKADSESSHHPTEVTPPLAEQEGAEPTAQLSSKNKKSEEEAA